MKSAPRSLATVVAFRGANLWPLPRFIMHFQISLRPCPVVAGPGRNGLNTLSRIVEISANQWVAPGEMSKRLTRRNRLLRLLLRVRLTQQRNFRPCRLSRIKCNPELQICTARGPGVAKISANQNRACCCMHAKALCQKILSYEKF